MISVTLIFYFTKLNIFDLSETFAKCNLFIKETLHPNFGILTLKMKKIIDYQRLCPVFSLFDVNSFNGKDFDFTVQKFR